jgi:Putative DNA-binding domain
MRLQATRLLAMTFVLRDLQAAFAAHIVEGDGERLTSHVVGDSIAAAARLRVHRHHVFDSLATALAGTFATVRALVGEDFFRTMARAYVARTLPAQPVLTEYGADFPGFVADYGPAQGLPYLADIARLDWALNAAFQAPRVTALGVADLQAVAVEQLPAQRLALAPGHAQIHSRHPIDRIWAAAQPGAGAEALDLLSGPVRLLVLRRADDAAFVAIGLGEASFLAALAEGETLEAAAAWGLGADPGFDLSAGFARFLGLGVFAALR